MGLAIDPEIVNPEGRKVVYVQMTEGGFVAEISPFETRAEAQEVAALFPKSYRVYAHSCSGETYASRVAVPSSVSPWEHPNYEHGEDYSVSIEVRFHSNGVNKGVNETGIKRARNFLAKAEALGYEPLWMEPGMPFYQWATRYGGRIAVVDHNYLTREQGEAFLR